MTTNESLQEALTSAQEPFADQRFHLCRLEAAFDDHTVTLSGKVLDDKTLTAALTTLREQLPNLQFATGQVQVLDQGSPVCLVTTTNLTSLQAKPKWISEQQSQVTNGTTIEKLDQEGAWTFGRLSDGYLGWVYSGYHGPLTQQRPQPTHIVAAPLVDLRGTPDDREPLDGRLFMGTYVAAGATIVREGWAELTLAGGLVGYVPDSTLRPLGLNADLAARRGQIVADAMALMGVPYLWGGTSSAGIDCSGFAQLLHKLAGVTIPRDADVQYASGHKVEPPFETGDLLYFGASGDHRSISHVGMSLGTGAHPNGWQMIHSGRSKNGVYIDNVQSVDSLRERFQGGRRFLS